MIGFRALARAIRFSAPPRNDIVILFGEDYWLRRLVLRDTPATTLEVYPQRLHISLGIAARTVWRLMKTSWRGLRAGRKKKDAAWRAYQQYVLACIDATRAKVVITFLDNVPLVQQLSRLDDRRTYYAVQNGTRTIACVRDSLPPRPEPESYITTTNLFCFGRRDIDLYERFEHKLGECRPVGSLIGGYYKSQIAEPAETKFDLCLISQWQPHFFGGYDGTPYEKNVWRRNGAGVDAMMTLLRRLLDETGLRIVVCPRNDADAAEVAFYRERLGADAHIATSDRKDFSTYRMVDQSRLAMALNSTTLAEIFSWGTKVLWCNPTNDEHFQMPEAGISYFHGTDYNEFRERVLALLAMPRDEYERQTRAAAQYINQYDPQQPAHDVIRATVLGSLN